MTRSHGDLHVGLIVAAQVHARTRQPKLDGALAADLDRATGESLPHRAGVMEGEHPWPRLDPELMTDRRAQQLPGAVAQLDGHVIARRIHVRVLRPGQHRTNPQATLL